MPADGDQALARAGRRREHDVVAGGQRERRLLLVRVQRAAAVGRPRGERVDDGPGSDPTGGSTSRNKSPS